MQPFIKRRCASKKCGTEELPAERKLGTKESVSDQRSVDYI